jgi:hypothetical protein
MYTSSLASSFYSLISASFRMIASTEISSVFFLYLLTTFDFRSLSIQSYHLNFRSLSIQSYHLNFVFLLSLFSLVSTEVHSLRSYHQIFLLDDQPIPIYVCLIAGICSDGRACLRVPIKLRPTLVGQPRPNRIQSECIPHRYSRRGSLVQQHSLSLGGWLITSIPDKMTSIQKSKKDNQTRLSFS